MPLKEDRGYQRRAVLIAKVNRTTGPKARAALLMGKPRTRR